MIGRVRNRWQLVRWNAMARRAITLSDSWQDWPEDRLTAKARELAWRVRSGEPLKRLSVECGAIVREATRRRLGMAQYPVQLIGGYAILDGNIAEMQTGEGKTITALLPAFARGTEGRGCHVLTSNDYLAQRDAEKLASVYHLLGLSAGFVVNEMEPDQRRLAYHNDVTYSTAKEVGFDFLRDRITLGVGATVQQGLHFQLVQSQQSPVQRGHHFALVDEADAILIDEATTPLIIAVPEPADHATVALYRWCAKFCRQLDSNEDFEFDARKRLVRLTQPGCRRVLLARKSPLLAGVETEKIYSQVENSLVAELAYHRDRDYMVIEDKVVIVDESTGRVMEGRKWQDGMHQAIEAKESLPITGGTGSAAQVASQSYFKLYTHLGGMTGTAASARRELKKSYELSVATIPTHRRNRRRKHAARVFSSAEAKYRAVAEEVEAMLKANRAVLVGTPSVNASETLGALLQERGVEPAILNAKYHEQEAEIVARAGENGHVTIATNMAGRGTDIGLQEQVLEAGGLHVIATEIHSSPRIDRQLIGRSGRQGDPGSFRFYMSLDDELLRILPQGRRDFWRKWVAGSTDKELSRAWSMLFRQTQNSAEKRGRRIRRQMLKQEKQKGERYELLCLDPYLEYT